MKICESVLYRAIPENNQYPSLWTASSRCVWEGEMWDYDLVILGALASWFNTPRVSCELVTPKVSCELGILMGWGSDKFENSEGVLISK